MTKKDVKTKGFGDIAKKKFGKITPPTSMEDFLSDEPDPAVAAEETKPDKSAVPEVKAVPAAITKNTAPVPETAADASSESSLETSDDAVEKKRTTIYMSLDALDNLDDLWMKLRRMADSKMRTSISKSRIVEHAIRIMNDELNEKGRGAEIVDAFFGEQ